MISRMKYFLLGVFVFFFVVTPLYVLNTMVIPDLLSLKGTYANMDVTANRIAGTPPATR